MRGHGTRHGSRRAGAVVLAGALALGVACSPGDDAGGGDDAASDAGAAGRPARTELPTGYEGHVSEVYADAANWLCRPGMADDVCSRDLDATAVDADGSTEVIRHQPADDPPVDCFYVYPTTSNDPGPNSDLEPSEHEEISTVLNQAARLTSTCRVFAPVYRQATLGMIGRRDQQSGGTDPWAVAYGDVRDAFAHYMANDSDGRGFVLIGHSQGAGMLSRLIAEEIDDEPLLRDRLVSAYILGSSVQVPEGEVVGGTFRNVPLCEADDQTGCVVSYASYRASEPPTGAAFFGRGGDGTRAACVNPADVAGGGPVALQAYFAVQRVEGALLGGLTDASPFADPARNAEVETPWVTYPDFVVGECVDDGDYTYLALDVEADPADPRTDDIGGDLDAEWGMHLVDANVAMGDIVDLVAAQAEAYGD
jgi:Protein of unknown function (DUF3089)